jgi:Fic family protein
MDKYKDFKVADDGILKVRQYGKSFIFQIGLQYNEISYFLGSVVERFDAYKNSYRPIDHLKHFDEIALVTAVYGTNTIEGATLSKEETRAILKNSKQINVSKDNKTRVLNLGNAYEHAYKLGALSSPHYIHEFNSLTGFDLKLPYISEQNIKELHKIAMQDLSNEVDSPGCYRNERNEPLTIVGDKRHGHFYIPPKAKDVEYLMTAFCAWLNSDPILKLHPLYRAPLAHFYFELIHPFKDGNGRVGRLIEAFLLYGSGYGKLASALSGFYEKNISQYFSQLNQCGKLADKDPYPNTGFVKFFLERFKETVVFFEKDRNDDNKYCDYMHAVRFLYGKKKLNSRQKCIMEELINAECFDKAINLQQQPWYLELYRKLSDKTKQRDIKDLIKLSLLQNNKETGEISLDKLAGSSDT